MPQPLCQDLYDVFAASWHEIWAVGEAGTIVRFNGWETKPSWSPTTRPLRGIHGSARDNIYAVGGGVVLHFDGVEWSGVEAPDCSFGDVWCRGPGDVYFVGYRSIFHYADGKWQEQASPYPLHAISGSGDFVCAVGSGGTAVDHGSGWRFLDLDVDVQLHCVAVAADGVFAAGSKGAQGVLFQYYFSSDGRIGEWSRRRIFETPAQVQAVASSASSHGEFLGASGGLWHSQDSAPTVVWADSTRDIVAIDVYDSIPPAFWAVGKQGTFLRGVCTTRNPDDITWKAYHSGPGTPVGVIRGLDAAKVAALAGGDRLLIRDDPQWRLVDTDANTRLDDFWMGGDGTIVAVGCHGTIVRGDAAGFQLEESGTTADLGSVWGSSPDDVWVGGTSVLLHRQAGAWRQVDTGWDLKGDIKVHGRGPGDVYVSGRVSTTLSNMDGLLLHGDGSIWSELFRHEELGIRFVRAVPDSPAVILIGDVYGYLVPCRMWCYDGVAWQWTSPPLGLWGPTDLAVLGSDDIWMASEAGLWQYNGLTWSITPAPGSWLTGAWGNLDSGLFISALGGIWHRPLH